MALAGISSVYSQDWPQWRGPNRDGVVTGFTNPGWPAKLTRQWTVNVGKGDATPALVDDKLYTFTRQGEKEVIQCLDAHTGSKIWSNEYEAQAVTGAAARHPGPRSSPAVYEGKIVTLGVGGVLSCFDATGGKLLWRKDPFPEIVPTFFTAMSPLIVDGMCISHLGTAGNGAIIAYHLDTGEEKWRWDDEGPEYASPALMNIGGTSQLVTLTEKSIVGVAVASGKLLWKIPFAPQSRAYNAATPIVHGQVIIYTGAARGTHAAKIEKKGDEFTVSELWSNPDVAPQFSTPVLKDDMIYGSTNMDYLFCLDAGSGETAWMDTIKNGRGGFAAILDAGDVVMALPGNSHLIVYEPLGKEYRELDRLKVADTPTYAHPVIAGNRIYIKDEENITLWIIE
jgi:outer membrane protein assembly factor BamB